ncbi:MAG: hypothetical protein ACYCOU_23410 [Sulfobacillus sp.]
MLTIDQTEGILKILARGDDVTGYIQALWAEVRELDRKLALSRPIAEAAHAMYQDTESLTAYCARITMEAVKLLRLANEAASPWRPSSCSDWPMRPGPICLVIRWPWRQPKDGARCWRPSSPETKPPDGHGWPCL